MDNLMLLNPNFFFLKDSYPELYDKCKEMDLLIINEKYNQSVIISRDILYTLLKIVLKTDGDLDKLVDKLCNLHTTALEIGLYVKEIKVNSQRAIQNSRRFSKTKAIKNAEMVYEVTSYFLYEGVNPLNPYEAPQYYDDWVKQEMSFMRDLDEYSFDFEKAEEVPEVVEEPQESNKKIEIKIKTGRGPVIRFVIPEKMADEFNPVIDIDYVDE